MVSIIVTHKKNLSFLGDCFESIANQSFKDYETILVVDHSEDDVSQLVAEYKEKINLTVYELEDKEGVSAGRNLGMDKAKGEYVYFIDNDDYLYGDTIGKLVDLVSEDTDYAYGDIYHTQFRPISFNPEQRLTERAEFLAQYDFEDPYAYRLETSPRLEHISALGALYKKSFLEKYNIRFDEDNLFFADAAFTVAVLKNGENIACSKESIYVKRKHNDKTNNPSIVQLTYEERFDDYERAYLSAIAVAGDDERIKRHLDFIISRFWTLEFAKKYRWDESDNWRGEFVDRFSKLLKNVDKKALYEKKKTPIEGLNRTEKRLVYAGAKNDRKKIKKLSTRALAIRKFKRMLQNRKVFFRWITIYFVNRMSLKEEWIVFESFLGRNYSGQPKYIYQYMQKHYKDKYKFIWVINDKKTKIDGNCKKIKRWSFKYFYYLNRSKYWVFNSMQPLSIPRRDETILLQTWHGTPLKRLAFDMEDVHSAADPKYKEQVYKKTRGWNYMLSDNPFASEKFCSCYLYDRENILEAGYPANDPMYAPDIEEKALAIKKKLGIPLDKKVIMYAPTWRDDNYHDKGEYGFDTELDVDRLQKEFGDEYVLLLRLHYFIVDQLDLSKYGEFTIDGSRYDDVTDLYLVTDIIMTDYSSVFFDFANLKRPMLFYAYDFEKYRDVLHGFYLDMEKDLPGPILYTNDEVVDAIKNIDKITEQYKERYEEFYNRFCCIDDGHAAQRVVETVFGK